METLCTVPPGSTSEAPADPSTLAATRKEVTHGLCSRLPVVTTYESELEWFNFHRSWKQRLLPVGPEEEFMVEEIALFQWRQRRISRYETELINQQLQEADTAWTAASRAAHSPEQLAADLRSRLLAASVPSPEAMLRLQRYESHLIRSFRRRLQDLDDLQRRRKQAPQPTADRTELINCSPPSPAMPASTATPPVRTLAPSPPDQAAAGPPSASCHGPARRTLSEAPAAQSAALPSRSPDHRGPQPPPRPRPPAYGEPGYRFTIPEKDPAR